MDVSVSALCVKRISFAIIAVLTLVCTQPDRVMGTIQCYQCTVVPPGSYSNKTARLCSGFDRSERYVVECPYSTMCMKRAFTHKLLNGESIEGVERDCAHQKHNYQTYKSGAWRMETSIQEPYDEGCEQQRLGGGEATTYCYCRAHMCNGASPPTKGDHAGYHADAMAVIFVFNAMKYLRSTRQ